MNPRLEDFVRRYRERWAARGCRADIDSDAAIVRAHRSVLMAHARRAVRVALGRLRLRAVVEGRANIGATLTISGNPVGGTWTISRGTPLAEIARFRESIRRARPRISVADAGGTVRWSYDVQPPSGLQSRLDDSMRPRRLTDWLRRSFEQAREPIREALTRPYQGKRPR